MEVELGTGTGSSPAGKHENAGRGPRLAWAGVNFSVRGKPILREVSGEVEAQQVYPATSHATTPHNRCPTQQHCHRHRRMHGACCACLCRGTSQSPRGMSGMCAFHAITHSQVCAILGPSGAGKSSLLNVLAGRSSSRVTAGIDIKARMYVDGQLVNPVAFRRNVAYVMQDDALLATATPREALRFSAVLRLGLSETENTQMVEKMLADLDLEGCADVCVGGELIKGISGGQR